VDSFESELLADESVFGSEPLRAILIRAPMITKVGVPNPVFLEAALDIVLIRSRTPSCRLYLLTLLVIVLKQAGPGTKTIVQHNGNPVLLQQANIPNSEQPSTCTDQPASRIEAHGACEQRTPVPHLRPPRNQDRARMLRARSASKGCA
jgi:hypothetical protein